MSRSWRCADGPGSFTGIRVSRSPRPRRWRPRARRWSRPRRSWFAPPSRVRWRGERVLALSSALRGEVYAGVWRLELPHRIEVVMEPRTLAPRDIASLPAFDRAVGDGPEDSLRAVGAGRAWPEAGDPASPHRRARCSAGRSMHRWISNRTTAVPPRPPPSGSASMAARCQIRPATPADTAALAELERICFSDPWSPAGIREMLSATAHHRARRAHQGLDRRGTRSRAGLPTTGEILNLAVAPNTAARGLRRA